MGKGQVFMGSNAARSRASGLMGAAGDTQSHIGELLAVVIGELVILAILRKKLSGHHGG